MYWDARTSEPLVDVRSATFNALVDTTVSPDSLLVITKGEGKLTELTEGPLTRALARAAHEPTDDAHVPLVDDVTVRPTLSLEVGLSKINLARLGAAGGDAHHRLRALLGRSRSEPRTASRASTTLPSHTIASNGPARKTA